MRFKRHYTLEQARALLPQIRAWLQQLHQLQHRLLNDDSPMGRRLARGEDLGGPVVNDRARDIVAHETLLSHFAEREILIKDAERGLIDFPALHGDREVFLCWELDEDDIEYWHELDAGYAGRQKLKGDS